MSINKVILVGRLGHDPSNKITDAGVSITNFSVATSEVYTDKSGDKKETVTWHNVVCFNKLADIAKQYLAKGRQVYIEGKLQTRSYDDKNGVKKYVTEIVANNIQFLGDKQESNPNPENNDGIEMIEP